MNIKLIPLQEHEKETFIRNIQIAFKKAVVEQFGPFNEEIIPRDHVIRSFEAEGAEHLFKSALKTVDDKYSTLDRKQWYNFLANQDTRYCTANKE